MIYSAARAEINRASALRAATLRPNAYSLIARLNRQEPLGDRNHHEPPTFRAACDHRSFRDCLHKRRIPRTISTDCGGAGAARKGRNRPRRQAETAEGTTARTTFRSSGAARGDPACGSDTSDRAAARGSTAATRATACGSDTPDATA